MLRKQSGIDALTGAMVSGTKGGGVTVKAAVDGKEQELKAGQSAGRHRRPPNSGKLGAGDRRRQRRSGASSRLNERMQTNVPGIYAIGDVIGRAAAAHVARRRHFRGGSYRGPRRAPD